MKKELFSGYDAAAYGAMLASVGFIPIYPTSFASEIANKISYSGQEACKITGFESQSSALAAAIGSEACERRTFVASNSLEAMQEFYDMSAMRLPIVSVMKSHRIFALRDSGFIIFLPESNQEILDTVIQAYRICEDSKVLLPAIINVDSPGFRETIIVPNKKAIEAFLPKLRLQSKLDFKNPLPMTKDSKIAIQLAMKSSLKLIEKIDEKWKIKFKRSYGLVEKYFLDDAEYAFVVAGYNAPTAKSVVKKLREQGEKVGLLRLRVFRPFPDENVKTALKNVKRVAVVEQNVSLGDLGVFYQEVKQSCGFCSDFIPMKYMNEKDFFDIFARLKKAEKEERLWVD
ncbi:MAG: hypothetical protein V1900_00510 [Candidatus Aenigmatarchaeota archaeon]